MSGMTLARLMGWDDTLLAAAWFQLTMVCSVNFLVIISRMAAVFTTIVARPIFFAPRLYINREGMIR
jgi:hypothetical protein